MSNPAHIMDKTFVMLFIFLPPHLAPKSLLLTSTPLIFLSIRSKETNPFLDKESARLKLNPQPDAGLN